MALVFKPLARSAVYLRGVAQRLAAQMTRSKQGAASQIVDGYILRALRAGENEVVYVFDPLALWAFLHHMAVPEFGTYLKLAAKTLTRDDILPAATTPALGLVEKTVDTVLIPYSPGQGFYNTIDLGALFIRTNFPSVPHTQPDRAGTCVLAATTGNIQALFATDRFQLLGDSMARQHQPKFYLPGGDTSEFVGSNLRLQAWVLPESGLQLLVGDANARLYTRQMSRYSYKIPTLGAHVFRDGYGSWEESLSRWGEVVVGGAYVSQPTGVDGGGVDPTTDPARLGVAGVFLAKLLRPNVPPTNSYALTPTAAYSLLMNANPETELRPVVDDFSGVVRYEAHGVSGAAMAFQLDSGSDSPPDGLGSRGAAYLFYTCFCNKSGVIWSGVQLLRIPSSGAQTTTTLYKSTGDRGHDFGPDIPMFNVPGVVGATYQIVDDVQLQTSTDFIHYGADGVIRTTGLSAAGWYPFTQYLLNTTDKTVGTLFGQSSHFAAAIGDDKVAVLARNYAVAEDATEVNWTLVVVDQTTGAFVEARGLVGAAFTVEYNVHITVVTPETPDAPAVLVVALGLKHYLSADGGVTWAQLFQGFNGKAMYLGNQLHEVQFERTL